MFNVSVGTSLRVTPHVFEDEGLDKLKLLVAIEDGQQESQTVDDIPVVTRSVINTQALLNINESVLIGGIVREATLKDNSKVPLLGDIPVVGNLFSFKREETERVERLFLISPRLTVKTVDQIEQAEEISAIDQSLDLDFYFETDTRRGPKYPKRAAERGIEGYCIVDYEVRRSGKTDNVRIDRCSNDIFAAASVRAVKKFKYRAKFKKSDMIDIADAKAKIVFDLEQS